jgi:hypothetical protein
MESLTLIMLVKGIAWGGSAGLIMWLASHYGDQVPWFKALDSWRQRVVMIVAATLVSFACYALVTYVPDTFWQAAQPYFLIASAVAAPILAQQGIYLARRTGPMITDMNKIRAAGMIVPDDHPMLGLMKARVNAEAMGSDTLPSIVGTDEQPPEVVKDKSFDGHA